MEPIDVRNVLLAIWFAVSLAMLLAWLCDCVGKWWEGLQ